MIIVWVRYGYTRGPDLGDPTRGYTRRLPPTITIRPTNGIMSLSWLWLDVGFKSGLFGGHM